MHIDYVLNIQVVFFCLDIQNYHLLNDDDRILDKKKKIKLKFRKINKIQWSQCYLYKKKIIILHPVPTFHDNDVHLINIYQTNMIHESLLGFRILWIFLFIHSFFFVFKIAIHRHHHDMNVMVWLRCVYNQVNGFFYVNVY